ncbi:RNA polymerase sigma factor [Trujillonella humicola]|uniref:RNA polymerase sigma factor n=1 Tax=Trujillonella humicola TaxID=3383699 RepID=UPI003906A5A3
MEEAPQIDRSDDEEYEDEPVIGPLSHLEFTAATLGLAMRLTHDKDDAEDLSSDVELRLLERPGAIPRDKDQAKAYARTVMTNLFIDQWRKYKVREKILDTIDIEQARREPARALPVADQALRFESRQALAAAINQLTPALQEIVRTVYDVEQGDFNAVERKEAAEALGITRNAADVRLMAAKAMLRELLTPFWREEDPS